MNFVVAKFNDTPNVYFPRLQSSHGNKEYIFVEVTGLKATETYKDTHIGSHNRATRIAQLSEGRIFSLVVHCSYDPDATRDTSHHFRECELTILDKPVTHSQKRLTTTIWSGDYLTGIDGLGAIVETIPLRSYYSSSYYVVTDEGYVFMKETNHFSQVDPAYVKPMPIIAKVMGSELRATSSERIIARLLPSERGYYTIMDGGRKGGTVSAAYVNLPTEAEKPIWERKVIVPRNVESTPQLKDAIIELSNTNDLASYICQFLHNQEYVARNSNCYFLQYGGPDYLAVAEDYTKVSYLPSTKVAGVLEKGQDPYSNPSRVTVTWSKLAGTLFISGLFSNAQIEQFHNQMTAACVSEFGPEESKPELLIVRGEDIKKYYHEDMYARIMKGELWNSCMRYAKTNEYFGLYVENEDKVGLLISRDRSTGLIHGRGLVWQQGEDKYVDRIYTISEVEKKRMQSWAEKQGYLDIWNNRNRYDGEVAIQLTLPYQKHYPYMDSMAYLNPDTGMLYNQAKKGTVEMRSQSGSRPHKGNEVRCAASERYAPKTKMVTTISKQMALAAYVKELRTGGHELERNTLEDELAGGIIAAGQVAQVRIDGKELKTLQANPDICWVAATNSYLPASLCAYSKLDKGFILKDGAELMPDGTYCSPAHAQQYKNLLLRRQPNKAKAAVAPVAAREAVLA